jgi:hypothetical protein
MTTMTIKPPMTQTSTERNYVLPSSRLGLFGCPGKRDQTAHGIKPFTFAAASQVKHR